ncbi:zinc ribbon domain-containing protein [Desulfomonile tiedjei]|uniref:Uncharacterized protein n=1 Tax=Desulfomonile tiedjei (strain ATCC 49306 / DSM 6799 / DCB-1) TaxID=706587 RepID=I4C910_DESTA|nr:zinc ribbon domain-containing protein [Desulfomonile tiedjei]AFM26051.1 hypothetical protein Desti_3397 [Desulfomonile tiedjei DSM 6799]
MSQSSRKVSAKELAEDIKSGLNAESLMKKYGVSAQGLQRLLNQLLQKGLITEEDLSNLMSQSSMIRCNDCGRLNDAGGKFCSECGAKLTAARDEQRHAGRDNWEDVSAKEKATQKDSIKWAVSRKQQILGIVFVTFPVVIFLVAKLGLNTLGDKPPYDTSGVVLYISLTALTIGCGLFSVWLLWGVFKPIATRLAAVKETSSPERLPDSFLDLNTANRKLALNLMWSTGLGLASREAAAAGSTLMARYGVPWGGWLGKILVFIIGGWSWFGGIGMCVAIAGAVVKPAPNDQVTDIPWMFLAAAGILMFGAFVIACYHFVSFFVDRLLGFVLKAEKTAHHSAAHHQNLKQLAISFIGSAYGKWFEEMKRIAQTMALSEAGMKPESSFLLFSHPTALEPNGIPIKRNAGTYIFSNGHVTAVSNVIFDMEATSYTLVEEDVPTYSVSKPDTWNTDEFHYQDVVEVTYMASQETGRGSVNAYLRQLNAKIRAKLLSEATRDGKPVEGFLVLSLVNGGNKQYPATKSAAQGFLSVARSKVREAKGRRG